jgi:uncharacterized delta-60 repeat protein
VAVDPSGRTLIFVQVTDPVLGSAVVVTRLDVAGALDTTFGSGGWTLVPNSAETTVTPTAPVDMKTDALGRVVLSYMGVGGLTRITRLAADGAPDPSWTDVVAPNPSITTYDFEIDASNRIVALGGTDLRSVARYVDGNLDPTFGTGGLVGPYETVAVQVAPDGRIDLMTGEADDIHIDMVVLKPDGTPDTSVGAAGTVRLRGITSAADANTCRDTDSCQFGDFALTDGGTRIIDWLEQYVSQTIVVKLVAP